MTEEEFDPAKFREEWDTYRKERNDRLHRFFVRVMIIFALLGFTVAGSVVYVYTTSENNKEALCAYQADLVQRVASGEQFLKDNPNGIPGISEQTIRASIDSLKQSLKSFAIVNCPESMPPESTPHDQ